MKLIKPNFWKTNNIIVYLLWPLTIITNLILFFRKNKISYNPKIKCVCVGNIYLGGTGKTPLVIKINDILKRKFNTFVIKKFYKNQTDEQKLLKRKTKLILPKNRIKGLYKLEHSKKNIAIFDDGLQDKQIKYSISIVCFNSLSSIGNGKLLPAGPLRENLYELKNYNAVFINGKKNIRLEKKIRNFNEKIKIFRGKYILKNKKSFSKKKKYLAFCGIGTPESFFYLLKDNNIKVGHKIIFPDHYDYNFQDIKQINDLALEKNLKLITTEKDFVKLTKFKNLKLSFADVDLKIFKFSLFKKFLTNNL